jgi:hypothetical protein
MTINGREYTLRQATEPSLHDWAEVAEVGEYTYWYRWIAWKTEEGICYAHRDELDNYTYI